LLATPPSAGRRHDHQYGVSCGQPFVDGGAGLLGDLELHRPAGLFLDDSRSIANSLAGEHIIASQPNEVAAPELTVDSQIEHRKIALAALYLEANTDGPDILRLQWALLTDQAPFVPWDALLEGNGVFSGHGRLR
jgi:hypothetical protein